MTISIRSVTSSQNSGQNAYSYDRFGNRWSQTLTAGSGHNSSLAYDANNRIISGVSSTKNLCLLCLWDQAQKAARLQRLSEG